MITPIGLLHQPQGDKQKINISSVVYWKTIKNMLRPAWDLSLDPLTAGRKLWNWWAPQIIGNVRIMAGHLIALRVKRFISCLSPWRGWRPLPPFGQRPLVLKEGAVRLSFLALRACSYKTKAEAWQQGNAPYSSRGGCRFLLIVMTQMNTDLLVDNQRNQRNLRANNPVTLMTQITQII